jgi:hypothetical protein
MEAKIRAEIRANQERMEAKMGANRGKIDAWLDELSWRKERQKPAWRIKSQP